MSMETGKNVELLQRFIGRGSISVVQFSLERVDDFAADAVNQGALVLGLKKANKILVARFFGPRNIVFKSGPYDDIVLGGLTIENMTNAQWPNVKVKVHSEKEETELFFYCSGIEFLSGAI